MKIKMSVKDVKKPVFNKREIVSFINEMATNMQDYTITNAPEDTGTLKNHGIEREQISSSIYGEKVFLDTEAVRNNYPSESQKKRPDGGNYPFYQEEGWTQHGISHPGKHYFERAYNVVEAEAEADINKIVDKLISFK